jgi:Na+/H+ antiporter NhaD/arsenite permease-like protein
MALETKMSDQFADGRMARSRHRMPTWLRWTLVAVSALGICAVGALFGQHVSGLPWLEDLPRVAAILIFAATYLFIAIGKLPGYHLDRAGAALLGASLMVGFGVLSLDDAYRAIDFETITLLLGMMIVVANLRLSGFFRLVNGWVVTRARHPLVLLAAVVLVAGSFSAFLVNDTICLVMTPLVLEIVTRFKRDPIPYLLAIPMASNIGSTATITGNPQNMIIGTLSQIPYGTFASALWPVAAMGLILTIAFIALAFRREFLTGERLPSGVDGSVTS